AGAGRAGHDAPGRERALDLARPAGPRAIDAAWRAPRHRRWSDRAGGRARGRRPAACGGAHARHPRVAGRPVRITVPGDKSLTQRALILAALGEGRSRLSGLLHGGDAASTAGALRALGVPIPPLPEDGGALLVDGVGLRGLTTPADAL